jgi:hypothetical protein
VSAPAALQFVTASGTSLPMHSGINRRLLTATTPEFLSSLVTPSRRVVLQAAVPGAVHPAGGLKALTTMGLIPAVEVELPDVVYASDSVNQQGTAAATHASFAGQQARHSTARRALHSLGAAVEGAAQAHQQEQWQQQDGSQLAFYALPAWESQSDRGAGRQLLYFPNNQKRRQMMEGALDSESDREAGRQLLSVGAYHRRRMTEGALSVYQRHM